MSSPSLSSRSEQNHPPTADDPAEWRDPVPGAPGFAPFETWDSTDADSLRVAQCRGPQPGAPGFAPFETWDSTDADGFRVAQRRGPQRARLWLDGVEGFQRCAKPSVFSRGFSRRGRQYDNSSVVAEKVRNFGAT